MRRSRMAHRLNTRGFKEHDKQDHRGRTFREREIHPSRLVIKKLTPKLRKLDFNAKNIFRRKLIEIIQ